MTISQDIAYMWNLKKKKKDTNELNCKTEIELKMQKKLNSNKGVRAGRDTSEDWD